MAFWRRFLQRDGDGPAVACTALDVGTEFAKALVFEIAEDGSGVVRGVGRQRQGLSHMQSGTVADIDAVVDNCSVALQEAEEMAGFRPTQVVIGIAGERAITWETGLPNVDVRLVHAAVTGAQIDGYAVTNPVGFKGRNVRISIFNAFAPLVHLGALQSVAGRLDLELLAVVAEPYAVARCVGGDDVLQAGALFLDVGGGTTDVALVRQGGVEATRMFALGGRAFTKSLADRLDLPFARAEALKVDFARGLAVERAEDVERIVSDDVAVWAAGVELMLEELAGRELLPGRIHVCGGGSRLPHLTRALSDPAFARRLPFSRPPAVSIIEPSEVSAIHDATQLLVDQQDLTPMGLAYQAIEMASTESPLDNALRRVLRAMKVWPWLSPTSTSRTRSPPPWSDL